MTNAAGTTTIETPAVAEQGANVAPEKASSKKATNQKKGAPKGQKGARAAKTGKPKAPKKERKALPAAEKPVVREGTAKAKVIAMMQAKGGATLDEIRKVTKWQAHTVRGFISILGSKHGIKIDSTKREDGARVYAIAR